MATRTKMISNIASNMKPSRWNMVSLVCLTFSWTLFTYNRWFYPNDMQCVRRLYPYSPAIEAVRYSWINYADWFYPHTPLRGNPVNKPEVEQAWRDYTFDGVISVPYDKLQKFDLPSDFQPWPLAPIEGGGVAAVPSIFYHTNCLNLLRKYSHRSVFDYSGERIFDPTQVAEHKLRAQIHQCIEVLRQELVCDMELALYLLWPDPAQVTEFNEDNSVEHKCRDYQALHDWAEKNRVRQLHNGTGPFKDVYFPLVGQYEM